VFLFEKLAVYQKALNFAECISNLTSDFPRGSWYLADQLNRASLSISLNIAEGNGRWTVADRKNFFGIARGSVHECVPLMELCRRKKLLNDPICIELKVNVTY
jgi:four helix bundle protein